MYDKHPIRLSILHMVTETADLRGLKLAPLCSGVGLEPQDFARQDRIVVRAQVTAFLRQMARSAGEATLGLDLAAAARPDQLGTSGDALLSGRTLRECLSAHARHMPSLQAGVRIDVDRSHGQAHWRHAFLSGDPEQAAVLTEGIAGFCVAALRLITGKPDLPIHVLMPHRQHAPMRVYEEKLRCAVTFRPGRDTVFSFDALWLDRPNRVLAHRIGAEPGIVVPVEPGTTSLSDDATLRRSLHLIFEVAAMSGRLSLLDSAQTLGIPPRSLQRRLAQMDSAFETLVEEWRAARAITLLIGDMPIQHIAARLGYSHPAHFTRAFHRWHGMAPARYRDRLGAGAGLARNGN